jgi:glycosyltransferase involved in cell wall biosynthesis
MPLHKKIIISANSAWNVVNFRKGIVLELINHGFEVVVVSPKDEYVVKLCALGCQHININVDNKGINPINDLYLFFQYLKIFYQVEPNVILTYTVKPNIYGSLAAYIFSIPIVNNISGLGTAFIRGGLLGRIVNFLYKISLRKSECIFFQNHDDEYLFLNKNLVTKGKVSVLPGSGVNLEYYQPSKSNIVNKDHDEFVFLLIARLIWDKGIQEYVDAARFVKKYNPKARFQILGFLDVDNQTAVSHSEIDLWVAEGIVEYIGVTEDVRPHINSSDCVVLPSYREGVPKTLLEAAAMGKSIITTEVEGCKDVVDDGVNGYLCNVRDYNDLAEKMQTMLTMNSKDIEQMGLNGRKKMEQEFDEKIVINKYISIVNKIINGQ